MDHILCGTYHHICTEWTIYYGYTNPNHNDHNGYHINIYKPWYIPVWHPMTKIISDRFHATVDNWDWHLRMTPLDLGAGLSDSGAVGITVQQWCGAKADRKHLFKMDGWIAFSIQSDLFWVGDMSVSRFKWYPKTIRIVKWRFPEMGVPPSHLF